MKYAVSLLSLVLSSFPAEAATWTFHGCKDNYAEFNFLRQDSQYPWYRRLFVFDYAGDQIYYPESWSGVFDQVEDASGNWFWPQWVIGYSDTVTYDDIPDYQYVWFAVYGPSPDQFGGGSFSFVGTAGEYWLDFDSSAVPRISSSKPADFGKWAWDGSINPSWVEPLTKKGHGRGHK